MFNFIIDNADAQKRIDLFLTEKTDMSRNAIINLIEAENIKVNEKAIKKNYKLRIRDAITVDIPEAKSLDIEPYDIELDVRYEDSDVIVINKPKGLVVHPAPGNEDKTLVNALIVHCKDGLSGIGGVQRPGIVHRIDKNTSGLLIVAKNDFAHAELSKQLADRSLSRTYYALVIGNLKTDSGTISTNIGRSLKDRKKMAVISTGREAITHYQVLERYTGYTLVKCKLQTGRTHQIRVHMAHIGHPIAGDDVYGNKNDKSKIEGQCLHAKELAFIHPKTKEKVEVSCPLPDYFDKFIKKLGSQII